MATTTLAADRSPLANPIFVPHSLSSERAKLFIESCHTRLGVELRAPLQRRGPLGNYVFRAPKIRGWRTVSGGGLQGKGSYKRGCFFKDPAKYKKEDKTNSNSIHPELFFPGFTPPRNSYPPSPSSHLQGPSPDRDKCRGPPASVDRHANFGGKLRASLARPTILYYTILYYTILYYTILYYTILYYTILYYTILYYIIIYYNLCLVNFRDRRRISARVCRVPEDMQ